MCFRASKAWQLAPAAALRCPRRASPRPPRGLRAAALVGVLRYFRRQLVGGLLPHQKKIESRKIRTEEVQKKKLGGPRRRPLVRAPSIIVDEFDDCSPRARSPRARSRLGANAARRARDTSFPLSCSRGGSRRYRARGWLLVRRGGRHHCTLWSHSGQRPTVGAAKRLQATASLLAAGAASVLGLDSSIECLRSARGSERLAPHLSTGRLSLRLLDALRYPAQLQAAAQSVRPSVVLLDIGVD